MKHFHFDMVLDGFYGAYWACKQPVGCAMLAAVVLNMLECPEVEILTEYYRYSMMTGAMKWFCRMSGKKKFTPKDIDGMQKTAAFRAADRNPYSWNAKQMGEKYYRRYIQHFQNPDIHEFDMKHEVWLYDDRWHQPVLDLVCRCMEE